MIAGVLPSSIYLFFFAVVCHKYTLLYLNPKYPGWSDFNEISNIV